MTVVKSKKLATPNSVLLIADTGGGELPATLVGTIGSTDSCIAIGCKSAADGETEVVLLHRGEIRNVLPPQFEGTILTPSKRLAILTVDGDVVLESAIGTSVARIAVWLNDPDEPDRIVVGFE